MAEPSTQNVYLCQNATMDQGHPGPPSTTEGSTLRALIGVMGLVASSVLAHHSIERVSLGVGSVEAVGSSGTASLSSDGSYVAFQSSASNLVPGDTNAQPDVFVRDLVARTNERISVSSTGLQAAGGSWSPVMTPDGRFIAFDSVAMNLAPGGHLPFMDVFLHDRTTGLTERLSDGIGGVLGNNGSYRPSLSADGRFVAFESTASNLVAADTNHTADVFLRDRSTNSLVRVSVTSFLAQASGPSWDAKISADGRFVSFTSAAVDLVPGDTNAALDVFVHEISSAITARVSVNDGGFQALGGHSSGAMLSSTGRFLAFSSGARNLVTNDSNSFGDVFVKDLTTGRVRLVSISTAGIQANGVSSDACISADGRTVGFVSEASNLTRADRNLLADVFVRDLETGRTRRLSIAQSGSEANAVSRKPALSADGRSLAFESAADNLVPGDTNSTDDVFRVR